MASDDDKDSGGDILAGPGLIRRPAALAAALDSRLRELVAELEAVADCPSPVFELPQGLSPALRMERFCEALAGMGDPLFRGLAETYAEACAAQRFDPRDHAALFDQRGRALVDYFAELARVHGVAFATDDFAPPRAAVDRALAALRTALEEHLASARRQVTGGD